MKSLRTKQTEERYERVMRERQSDTECPLCSASAVRDFAFWKIVENAYPYDLIAGVHHLLVPRRHIRDGELSEEERVELREIKNDHVDGKYHYLLEPVSKLKSIPDHHHLHLIILKDD